MKRRVNYLNPSLNDRRTKKEKKNRGERKVVKKNLEEGEKKTFSTPKFTLKISHKTFPGFCLSNLQGSKRPTFRIPV